MSVTKMLFTTFIGALCLSAVAAEGEFQVLHTTNSLQFHGHERLSQDTLKEVLSACLGFTVEKSNDWGGLRILDPFEYSDAVFVLVVDGVKTISTGHSHYPLYPLAITEHEEDTWQSLKSRIEARFPHEVHNNSVHRIDLGKVFEGSKSSLLSGVDSNEETHQYNFLDPVKNSEDAKLLKQLQYLKALATKVETEGVEQDGLPDLYWAVLPGLHAVSQKHGAHSHATIGAQNLVFEVASDLSKAFSKAYNGKVVFAVVTTGPNSNQHIRRVRSVILDTPQSRLGRSLLQDSAPIASVSSDPPGEYSPDYPVIFNIILWFSVVLVFALIAISVAIADMDPGRDSIIYRMTSTRMKKDN